EEASAIAFVRGEPGPFAVGSEALTLMEQTAAGDIAAPVIARQVAEALDRLAEYQPAIAAYAQERAAQLGEDHDSVKTATGGAGSTTQVAPVLPADMIG